MDRRPRGSSGATFRQFAAAFWRALAAVSRVLLAIVGLHVALAWMFARVEGLDIGRALYFAAITGFTVGYGDIVPETTAGRAIAVGHSFRGVGYVGLVVAIATAALHQAVTGTSRQEVD
ncbi:MAG: potassium channel family protein [Gemmatimonadales bacterium]